MRSERVWSNRVLIAAAIFTGFGVAHLSDDILYGVPAEFNLVDSTAQALGLVFFAALVGLTGLAARGSRQGYQGLMLIGILLALADSLRHIPEMGDYDVTRSGLMSVIFSVGLIVSGLVLAAVAFGALRRVEPDRH